MKHVPHHDRSCSLGNVQNWKNYWFVELSITRIIPIRGHPRKYRVSMGGTRKKEN